MKSPMTFNLIDEPWIEVLRSEGSEGTLSLRAVFAEAGAIRRIGGELPTQEVAILRLLLAILHRAVPPGGDDADEAERWGEWWRTETVPETVATYLDEWHDRFDLLDSERPFFQVAGLRTAKDGSSGLGKLIADYPAGHKFFTNRAGEGVSSLSLAEGARWLLHCQSFDVSGIKSGAVGDPRVKGGRGYPIGTGWAGNLGVIVIEGASLLQTLLLNLVLTSRSEDEDAPVWEWDEVGPAPTGADSPVGPAQALTWQSRRIRLFVDDGLVTDVLISNGDQIRVRNQHRIETMTAWRRSEAQQKKHGEELVYMPQEHRADGAIWRGLGPLLAAAPVRNPSGEPKSHLQPANIGWVATARAYGGLPKDAVVTMHTVGVIYGSQNSVIESTISDRLTVQSAVLADRALQEAAVRAAAVAEQAARLAGDFARNIALAEGRDDSGDADRARADMLQRLDPAYRGWALKLGTESVDDLTQQWRAVVREAAERFADETYGAASRAAVRGRMVAGRGNAAERRIDAALAHRWFRAALRRDIPLDQDETNQSQEEAR